MMIADAEAPAPRSFHRQISSRSSSSRLSLKDKEKILIETASASTGPERIEGLLRFSSGSPGTRKDKKKKASPPAPTDPFS